MMENGISEFRTVMTRSGFEEIVSCQQRPLHWRLNGVS
jgi:hypothetical protein